MDNIEKLEKLKKLSSLKAELHKENLLAYFDWRNSNNGDTTLQKAVSIGETGYSIYQLFKKYTSETKED